MLTISSAYVSIRQETSAYVSIPFEETEEVLSRSHNTKNKGVVTPLSSLSLRNECVRFAGRPDASSQHQRHVHTGLGCRVEESHNEEYECAATGSLVSSVQLLAVWCPSSCPQDTRLHEVTFRIRRE